MVESQIENQIQDISYRLQSQGMPLEQYLQFTGMTMDTLRDQLKETAEKAVKSQLVLAEIAKAENIEVSDEDVDAEFKKMADMYGMEVEKVKELMGANIEAVKADLKTQKTVKAIVDTAKAGKAKKTAAKKPAAKKEDLAEEKKPAAKHTRKPAAKKAAEKPAEEAVVTEEKPKRTRKAPAKKVAEAAEEAPAAEKKPAAKRTRKTAAKKVEE